MAGETETGSWLPIVTEGPLLAQIDQALDELAVVLAPLAGDAPASGGSAAGAAAAAAPTNGRRPADAAAAAAGAGEGAVQLGGGPSGEALFFTYLDQARPERGYDERALVHLEAVIEAAARESLFPSLYGGFSGVAWALEHLTGRLLEEPASGAEDPGAEVAEVLNGYLRQTPWKDDYDLIGGLVGYGVYARERAPRPGGADAAASVVERLGELAERRDGGVTWHTPAERLALQKAEYPQGHYNLGVAHGVPGVIGLLGELRAAGLATAKSDQMLADSVAWLFGQRLPAGTGSAFGYNTVPGGAVVREAPSRLAWCYGDAGIVLTLMVAARAAGEPSWEAAALDIARAAAQRPHGEVGVLDGGLCHGSAGLAHLYNRLYQATREPLFKAQAIAWLERLLSLRQAGEGLGGWRTWRPLGPMGDPNPTFGWVTDPGFLTGAAGIGLTLLGAVSAVEPAWDRLLLTSVPPIAP
jgi:lantibiotic biosynthesis protein